MFYGQEGLKKERWWTGVLRSCGTSGGGDVGVVGGGVGGARGGGTLSYHGAGVMNGTFLDPCGPAAACLRCRSFRKKQRFLAFLTASTGVSFILLLLHTPSILLPHKDLLYAAKELPERSQYVKKDVHLLGEAKKVSLVQSSVLKPAVYRDRQYQRQKASFSQTTVRIESNAILKNYQGGSDIVSSDYFRIPPRQKQKSFERKLNLLDLRNYNRASPNGGEGGERSNRRDVEVGDWISDEEKGGGGGERELKRSDNVVLKVPQLRLENIDPLREIKSNVESLNQNHRFSRGLPKEVLIRTEGYQGERGGGGGGGGIITDGGDVGRRDGVKNNNSDDLNDEDDDNDKEELKSFIVLYDYKRPAYFPWRTTRDECANYATRFMVADGAPLVASVSFPGAGNTWLRYITEVLTGVFTGSVYHDETLALRGFWGERDGYRQGTTITQKTHSFPLLLSEMKDGNYNGQEFRFLLPAEHRKVVVLLRNPWESLIALRHYHAAGHTGFANMAFFKGPEWANFTSQRAQLWVQLYTSWLSLPQTNIHVMHYEQLQHGLEKEAKRLIKFLGLPLDYGRLECLIKYPEGRFRRPKYPKHLQGYRFPSSSVNILREGMGSVDSLLRQGGHPSLPTHLYSFTPPIRDSPTPEIIQ